MLIESPALYLQAVGGDRRGSLKVMCETVRPTCSFFISAGFILS